jgi:glycosyltransferase involved in cell wall biosynthesis
VEEAYFSTGTTLQRKPKVSVVMSVFNGERYLREAVSSILDQSFSDFEFIIINDGSTDTSGTMLDSYRSTDDRVVVYHQQNRGLTSSLNRGCTGANGKYIARMDADDIAVQDRLQRQVDFMENHPEVGVLGGAIEWINAAGKSLLRCRHPASDQAIKSALVRGDCPLSHPTVIMRKEAFSSVAGYRTAMVDAEDYDLWLRISDRYQLANLDAVVLKYRVHPNQVSVRKCRQQALSNLAARIAASSRRKGNADPFDSGEKVTSSVLTAFGISEAKLKTAAVRGCLSCISSMCQAGEYSTALDEIIAVSRGSELKDVESPERADLHLLTSELYWHQGKIVKSLISAGRAVITRPIILGRPLKPMMRRLGLAHALNETVTKC